MYIYICIHNIYIYVYVCSVSDTKRMNHPCHFSDLTEASDTTNPLPSCIARPGNAGNSMDLPSISLHPYYSYHLYQYMTYFFY